MIFDQLRKIKSETEIKMLKDAAKISSLAFISAMKQTSSKLTEGQIEAILEFEVRMNGAQRLGYPPVCAGGDNANIMHYVQNTQQLKDGELLLVDAGSEYHYYSSGIL
jgi:Xaa-Pro aminopeptidase